MAKGRQPEMVEGRESEGNLETESPLPQPSPPKWREPNQEICWGIAGSESNQNDLERTDKTD
jgi:hypothetical protein